MAISGISSIRSSARVHSLVLAWLVGIWPAVCLGDQPGAAPPRTPAEVYGQGVRETDKRSPEEESAGFHLPAGFVAELIAAEPQIAKPLNMAFDKHGALWITDTTEYPYPVPADKPAHDTIKVLRDKDGNGTFESVTTFADGLNIPIGILPVDDGVICFSIPNIMHLRDTDGDGRCDERKVLLGPFDTSRDTHGMINALRHGDDGWIYACHGFNNQSHVKAADGSEIHLISGNTFRFRADGSHVEQFTNGQVNPFGMTNDEWGNWFTADCHSKPVTLLVRGGFYESFGRPHDGLGFVPSVMDHLHGSTAICGITYYLADQFPEIFRRKFYSGNVMTSRINCNRLEIGRDLIRLVEEPDFMTSDDPWFRPVDIQLGPDGGLYVADFYNKIIGHYEVRLDHPERDRTSGRIWRIVYRGGDQLQSNQISDKAAATAWPSGKIELLSPAHLAELSDANATRRHLALERLDGVRLSPAQKNQLVQLATGHGSSSDQLRISALWALHRQQLDPEERLEEILASDASPLVQVAVLRAWEDRPRSSSGNRAEALRRAARAALASDGPQVALAGAGALAQHGDAADVKILLTQIASRPAQGSIPQHAMRIAVKLLLQRAELAEEILRPWSASLTTSDTARQNGVDASATDGAIPPSDSLAGVLADILPAVDSPRAAEALLGFALSTAAGAESRREAALRLACKHMSPELSQPVVALLKKLTPPADQATADLLSDTPDKQMQLARDAIATLRAGRHPIPEPLRQLVAARIERLADAIGQELKARTKPVMWHETQNKLWQVQDRARQGKAPRVQSKFLSSHTLGEAYVGTLSTAPFPCPAELSFWVVGHDGPPKEPAGKKTGVRLVLADSGKELTTAAPPRSDIARQVRWDLRQWRGQSVRLECYDQDPGNAYAWIGVGGFSLPELNPSGVDGAIAKLADLVELGVDQPTQDRIEQLLDALTLSDTARARLAAGLAVGRGLPLSKLLIDVAQLRGQTSAVKKELVLGPASKTFEACRELASALASHLTLSQQVQLARGLIASAEGRRLLLELVEAGRMAPESLRGLKDLLGTTDGEPASARLAELSEAASAAPSEAELAIVQRVNGFRFDHADSAKGKVLFEKNCANCHKLRGAGQLVGPQLDGVGARGAERLAEDVLLPNRNVDKAFRMSSLLLDDDRVVVGLVRESADGKLQVVGTDGKVQDVDSKSVASRRDTTRSLMPDNFAELLSNQDLADLLQFVMQP